jgi:hypothetical protein
MMSFFVFSRNGAPVEWNWQGKTEALGEKPVPVPHCPPQIPHGLTRYRTRTSAVGGRRLTAWAMAQSSAILLKYKVRCQRVRIHYTPSVPTSWVHLNSTLDSLTVCPGQSLVFKPSVTEGLMPSHLSLGLPSQWYSTFFVRVPPHIISLQLCTPKVVGA